jgi:membrane-associated protein
MVEFLRTALDRVLHLNVYLPQWADQMGPWLYVVLFAVIFCETGLVVTPFLPGDSLLFAVGDVIALPTSTLSLPLMLAVLIAAAVLGDAVNYYLGLRVGPAVFRSEKSRLFNRKHLLRTHQFYEKYGGKTIILARFIPIIRTFAPFVAGIGKMEYRQFVVFNATGGAAWVLICVFSGYFFGGIDFIQRNFELVLVAIVLISVLPMAIEFILARRRGRGDGESGANGFPEAVSGTAAAALETAPQPEATAGR